MNNAQRIEVLKNNRISVDLNNHAWSEFFNLTTRPGEEFDSVISADMLGPFISFMQETCPVIGSRVLENPVKDGSVEVLGLFLTECDDETVLISYILAPQADGQVAIEVHMLEDEDVSASVSNYFR